MENENQSRISKIRLLVDSLSDRDNKLKQDMKMFESFFENFPIPVTMWTISRDLTVMSQRGNGMACEDANTIEDLFSCPIIKDISLEAHEKAFQGEALQYMAHSENELFYVSLVPTVYDGEVSQVSGIAWNITSNAIMLASLENIEKLTSGKRGLHKEVFKEATRALSASRLRKLMHQDGKDG